MPSNGLDALTAIIQPQQVAEDKKVNERLVEFKLSNLEKSQKSNGSSALNFPGKRSK
jgi:heme-binding NEAT domain protein